MPDSVPPSTAGSPASEVEAKRALLPPVEFDSFETSLVELLNPDGSLRNESAAKDLTELLRQVRSDEHRALLVSVLKATKQPTVLNIVCTADSLKLIAGWLKVR